MASGTHPSACPPVFCNRVDYGYYSAGGASGWPWATPPTPPSLPASSPTRSASRSTPTAAAPPQGDGDNAEPRRLYSSFLYSRMSPGWQSSALHTASIVDSRIAFTFPFFNTEILAI